MNVRLVCSLIVMDEPAASALWCLPQSLASALMRPSIVDGIAGEILPIEHPFRRSYRLLP